MTEIINPDFREVDEPIVTIPMSLRQAEAVQGALSDVLCWFRGWMAAASETARDSSPLGVDQLRELNIAVKRAIERATK